MLFPPPIANSDYLPFLQTETDMVEKIRTNKLFLIFSYCSLFFKMSKKYEPTKTRHFTFKSIASTQGHSLGFC